MKITIFGAGAIGGYVGVKLLQAGAKVSLVARGEHLAAMRKRGLTLKSGGESETVHPFCTDDAGEIGVQDAVIVTVKAHALSAAASQIAELMGPDTTLVTAMNGVPYWYFHEHDSPWRGRAIEGVDPGGALLRALPPHHVLGAVVYPSGEIVAPGVIEHIYGNRLTLGEPDGRKSARAKALSALMTKAGLKAPVSARIRDEIWLKLWGNLSFNPLSALTGATLERLAREPELRAVARTMMLEAQAMAEKLGVNFMVGVERRMDMAGEVGAHKTSMLQDLERGRTLEIDAMLGAVVELGELTGDAMPMCRAVLALARERARTVSA